MEQNALKLLEVLANDLPRDLPATPKPNEDGELVIY